MALLRCGNVKTLKLHTIRSISIFPSLSQEPQLAEAPSYPPLSVDAPLPPNPATGSPLYNENWRNPIPTPPAAQSLMPLGFLNQSSLSRFQFMSQTLDIQSLMNMFSDYTATQRWGDMKQLFEFWIRSLDSHGKPNKPDVDLFNHYLRACVMSGATPDELLDLVAQMEQYGIAPNTASFNLVLKTMHQAKEAAAAEKLLERMLQTSKESVPDDESFDLVIGMLLSTDQFDSAFKYIDFALKSGYMLSVTTFTECVKSCVNKGRLDMLVSVIERCKKMDQNKALCPPWKLCNYIADIAIQSDNSELAYYALEFLAKWIARGEKARPPVLLTVDEGLVVSALATAGRTYNPKLLDGSWAILKRRQKVPSPDSFVAKITALASLGNLQKAFTALHELESAYGNSGSGDSNDLFSPFTTLYPLVVACSKDGFVTLDSVYYQLEKLSQAESPYKSTAALNCIILGCANTWDVDRAYQTFTAISDTFGLTPDIHSYNALMYAFGKLQKTQEASKVFDHLVSMGVKPNGKTYSLLVDAHLINRDIAAALSIVDEMVNAELIPSKEMLKNLRRRCIREFDYTSEKKAVDVAQMFQIRLGSENRRNMLFNLNYASDYAS